MKPTFAELVCLHFKFWAAVLFEYWINLFRCVPFLGPRRYRNRAQRLDGKVVVITGANCGIGKETALEMVRRGARVIIGCRDTKKGTEALTDIRYRVPYAKIELIPLDLASLGSVRRFVQALADVSIVDILINNAGIMWGPKSLTEDGFESQLGTNHLGHFLLTLLLLDKVKKSDFARIVNVSSVAHISKYEVVKRIFLQ